MKYINKVFIAICLLIFALCSCSHPFDLLEQEQPPLSPGMGYLTLSLNMQSARTIQPATPVPNTYELTFTETTTNAVTTETLTKEEVAANTPIILSAGTYSLTVDAFVTGNTNPVARGTVSNIIITAGVGATRTVAMNLITDANGTFSWNISLPNGLSTATMTIASLTQSGTTPVGSDSNLLTSPVGNATLPAGNYQVTITLTKADAETLTHYEVLRVFGGLESPLSIAFTNEHFYSLTHTVTLVYGNGTDNATQTVQHGDEIPPPALADPASHAFTPVAGLYRGNPPFNYIFGGWYNGTAEWNADDLVIGDMTLTAKWNSPVIAPPPLSSAVQSINNNAGEYTMLFDADATVDNISLFPNSDTTLTLQGLGTTRNITLASGATTLFSVSNSGVNGRTHLIIGENIRLSGGEVSILSSGSLTLSGNSNITLSLQAQDDSTRAVVFIDDFSGSVTLNLSVSTLSISTAISYWTDKQVLQGAPGHTLTAADIAKFTLGDFKIIGPSSPIANTHEIANSGTDMGKLVEKGTADHPFKVASKEDLQKIGNDPAWGLNKHYELEGDIDLSGVTDWKPIGYNQYGDHMPYNFTGTFDGGGFVVDYLSATSTDMRNATLFGYIGSTGTVKNLGVTNVSIDGTYIGGLAGSLEAGGKIENCFVTGTVSGGDAIGGIVGVNEGGIIENCYSTAEVSGGGYAGGIAGNSWGAIRNCYSTGAVSSAGDHAGGIVAQLAATGTIERCYSTGAVSAAGNNAGGIVGNHFSATAAVTNCVALNPSVSGASNVGRVAGNAVGTLTNNYGRDKMVLTGGTLTVGTTTKDGADVTKDSWESYSFWSNSVIDIGVTTPWQWNADKLPTLNNVGGVQNPQVQMLDFFRQDSSLSCRTARRNPR